MACDGSHSATSRTVASTGPSVGLSTQYEPREFSSQLFSPASEGVVATGRECSFGAVDIGITASTEPQSWGLSVTPKFTFSGSANRCGLPLPDCSSGWLTLATTQGRLLATVEVEPSPQAEVTNYCLGHRFEPVPFSVQTVPIPLPALPRGFYKFSLSLNGLRAVKQVELP